MMTFNFKAWQAELGLTDREAAKKLTVSLQCVRNYRRGHRPDQRTPVSVPEDVQARCNALLLSEFK